MLNRKAIFSIVSLISVLLLTNIFLIRYNNSIIRSNQVARAETETIKRYYDQIGKVVIHSLDIGLRGFALIRTDKFAKPMENSTAWKDSIISKVEIPLEKLGYDTKELLVLKDSVDAFIRYCFRLKQLLIENKQELFLQNLTTDKGAFLWGQYLTCEKSILTFLQNVDTTATDKYEKALSGNYLLQILLFIIAVPTLGFLAFHTSRTYALSQLVLSRTNELQIVNDELVEKNNQLEQYSFVVAHNLRAPLTRILGLVNVMRLSKSAFEKEEIIDKLESSTRDLDEVIKDLNIILEIKRQAGILTEVNLVSSFDRAVELLENQKQYCGADIKSEFQITHVLGVTGYIDSIMYSLISNAIKYRDPERKLQILVTSNVELGLVKLSVTDNGLGIDLTRFKQSIFGLYKRFHLHVEGKGLGLYLVKTQVEAMGGKIEVSSKLGIGSEFSIYLNQPTH